MIDDELSPRLRELASSHMLDPARVLGAAMRSGYLVSAAMPGILQRAPMRVELGRLTLRLAGPLSALAGERLFSRLRSWRG